MENLKNRGICGPVDGELPTIEEFAAGWKVSADVLRVLLNRWAQDEVLTTAECAARLKLSEDTLRDLVNYHGLPCRKINARLWRFHWPTVAGWLQQRN